MTQGMGGGHGADPDVRFGRVWAAADARVESGRIPGYVGAIRVSGQVEVHAAGKTAVDTRSGPMAEDTLFRLASLTKLFGGALALSLMEDGVLALDDPVARWLPEAANPRVLVAPDAPLERTIALQRPLTVRHLLTSTAGWGVGTDDTPLRAAMTERGVHPGPLTPPMSGDEFLARVTDLPLAFQPGEGWLYDTPIDVLGVLLARAAGKPVSDLIAERITGPLGLTSTSFWTADVDRLATAYVPGPDGLEVLDPPEGLFTQPPPFEELSSGLVSSAPDVLRFMSAMADGGGPVLSRVSVALVTADALTDPQRRCARPIVGPGASWGLATGVDVEAAEPWMAPGRWGWNGGTGTTAFVDPTRGTVGVLLTQRAMTSPLDGFGDFWTALAGVA